MSEDGDPTGDADEPAGDADTPASDADGPTDDADTPAGDADDAVTSAGGSFEDELERARELLERDDLDGVYVAGVSGDEYDYVFGHRGGDPEQVGMQAMGLLAQHVGAMVEQTGQPPAQVAGDAAMLARTLGVTGDQSLADIEAELDEDLVQGDDEA